MSPLDKIRVAELNDSFRQEGPQGPNVGDEPHLSGQWFYTIGFADLPEATVARTIQAVQAFDSFTPDNDSYGEHDFGSIEIDGHRIFWKIDCYDRDQKFASPDPSDAAVTYRAMRIMLAGEY